MTQQHPITPPPELLKQWEDDWFDEREHADVLLIQAFQAGADQELDACCEWLEDPDLNVDTYKLRAARRPSPKPPSLKDQALDLLHKAEDPSWDINDFTIVRRALEQLDD